MTYPDTIDEQDADELDFDEPYWLRFLPFGSQITLREILIGHRCIEEHKDIESRLNKLISNYPEKPKIYFTKLSLSTFDIEKVRS